jgi:anaerobic selenocysteine-containing dehydrogenase
MKPMDKLSRRDFLQKSSIGAVAGAAMIGALASEVQPAAAVTRVAMSAAGSETAVSSDPLVAYVRDGRRGEVAIMVGDREVVRRDPELVRRLLHAAN